MAMSEGMKAWLEAQHCRPGFWINPGKVIAAVLVVILLFAIVMALI